jgi:uncharacterized protein (DUF427 family)
MNDYPAMIVPVGHVEPVARRVRGLLAGQVVVDTVRARYVWESVLYPQYYVPLVDVSPGVLVPEGLSQHTPRGVVDLHEVRVGGVARPHGAKVLASSSRADLASTVRFEWSALDAWFEEDEQVFVHPRSPYVRVDTLRSTRPVRIELDGIVLAESPAPVLLFETGLPTRYYLNRTEVNFDCLAATGTVTSCPYKGTTSDYWSAHIGDSIHDDIAWAYDFPTRHVQPIAGMVAFYNERVDVTVAGQRLERPRTHFS